MSFFKFFARDKVPDGWSGVAPDLLTGKRFPPVWVRMEPATQRDITRLARWQGKREAWYDDLSIVGKSSPAYLTQKDVYLLKNTRWQRIKIFLRGK